MDKKEENTIFPPPQISINGYIYTFKDKYKKGLCYSCSQQSLCKVTIIITEEELKKANKDNKETTKYTINSRQNEHTCIKKEEKIKESTNVISKDKFIETAINIIKLNIDKDLEFHVNNLFKNKIYLSRKKIYNIRNKIKQELYPPDLNYINNILNIKINLSLNSENIQYNFSPLN